MKMTLKLSRLALLLAVAPLIAAGAPPTPSDYAHGITIETPPGLPLIETTVPDAVYRATTRADLGDVRVFNSRGQVVPHAFCAAPEAATPEIIEQQVPVFELRGGSERDAGSRVEVQTSDGTRGNVLGTMPGTTAAGSGRTHIIDARQSQHPLRAIQFDWQTPDGASEVKVRIEASADLERWEVLVPAATMLPGTRGVRPPKRERIELPRRKYDYLRVERVDGGPPLLITGVIAEAVADATDIEPRWFMADALVSSDPDVLLFDSARLAPVRHARLRLQQENSSLRVTLQSRGNSESAWRDRWHGETYLIMTDTKRRESPPAYFDPTTDRYWRVQLPKDAHGAQPMLDLGYRPARLRFLAQGAGPFTLAYGSRRAPAALVRACSGLLADVGAKDRAQLIGEGRPGIPHVLGGEAAYTPLPKKTPLRLVVLWGVLIAGVGLLVAMALSRLKRLR
jgi:Protein of unknown function (DUF3999)